MGFFNGILKGLGFEVEESEKKKKTKEKEPKQHEIKINTVGAKYDLEEQKKEDALKPKDVTVETLSDIQKLVVDIKTDKCINIDFEKFSQENFVRALDFLSGAMFALGGKIQKIDVKKYMIFLP